MKKTIKLFLPLITLCTIFSCQKEVDDFGAVVNPPNPTNDSIYLDKIYEIYDAGTGLDTQSVLTVSYDAQKRISGWIAADILTGPYTSYSYYYNGSDSLPFKSLFISYDNTIPDTTTSYHTYDVNGKNLRDSSYIVYPSFGTITISTFDYTYSGGKRYGSGKREIIQPSTSVINYLDTITLDVSGNFLSSVRYSDYNNGTMQLSSQANFTYDNKISPFAKQHIYKAHQYSPNGETLFYEYFSFNNMLSHVETNIISGSTPFDDDYSYTYNSNNLPVKATIIYGTDTTFMYYTYKPL